MADEDRQNGYEQELAAYEEDLASYLQKRIKPGLSSSAIPLVARSIAKEIARREPPESPESPASGESPESAESPDGGDSQAGGEQPDFEADMRELQAELGEEWILRFSVHGEDGWLTAESEDASQRVEAPNAQGLVTIVEAINEGGGRQR